MEDNFQQTGQVNTDFQNQGHLIEQSRNEVGVAPNVGGNPNKVDPNTGMSPFLSGYGGVGREFSGRGQANGHP